MAKSLSITVHPPALDGDYLVASDAMHQVLDLVEALECVETVDGDSRRLVWKLTEARTNSPPLTVTVEAFSSDPALSVDLEAARVLTLYASGIGELLNGSHPDWMDSEVAIPLKRAFKRNLNGVGRTDVAIDDEAPLNVAPASARSAIAALERFEVDEEAAAPDLRRIEYGTIQAEVCGLTRWNARQALIVKERLSEQKVTCVLSENLSKELGDTHKWADAWGGRWMSIGGALIYGTDGFIKRVEAQTAEEIVWSDVRVSDLKGVDVLQGRTVEEHLRCIWGDDLG